MRVHILWNSHIEKSTHRKNNSDLIRNITSGKDLVDHSTLPNRNQNINLTAEIYKQQRKWITDHYPHRDYSSFQPSNFFFQNFQNSYPLFSSNRAQT